MDEELKELVMVAGFLTIMILIGFWAWGENQMASVIIFGAGFLIFVIYLLTKKKEKEATYGQNIEENIPT